MLDWINSLELSRDVASFELGVDTRVCVIPNGSWMSTAFAGPKILALLPIPIGLGLGLLVLWILFDLKWFRRVVSEKLDGPHSRDAGLSYTDSMLHIKRSVVSLNCCLKISNCSAKCEP